MNTEHYITAVAEVGRDREYAVVVACRCGWTLVHRDTVDRLTDRLRSHVEDAGQP